MANSVSAEALLRLPVRLHGSPLAKPVDIVLDADGRRAIGVDVLCADDARRFLPLAAGRIGRHEIAVDSALTLLDEANVAFYRQRSRGLRSLRGAEVERGRLRLGTLVDVVLSAEGAVEALVVQGRDGERRIPFDEDVRIEPGRVSAARA